MSKRVMNYMRKAFERGVLVPAFNAAYPEMVKPICETLKNLGTYGLLETARPDIEKFGAISFTTILPTLIRMMDSVPIILSVVHRFY